MNTETVSYDRRDTLSSGKKGVMRPQVTSNKEPKEAVSHFGKMLD